MILSAQTLLHRQQYAGAIITPFCERTTIQGMTFGLSACGYDVRVKEQVHLRVGEFALASTVEHFSLPTDLVGLVKDKSTWARRGLSVFNTVIEPGWKGYLTLELANHGLNHLVIEAGSPIAQVLFWLLDHPTVQPYAGKYQNQVSGPQEAIMEPMLPNFIDPQLLEVPPMAEIIGIDGVKKLNNGADTEVIAYLEALLSRAKRAEITEIGRASCRERVLRLV